MPTLHDALQVAHAYWEAKGPSSRMMPIRANACAAALGMRTKLDSLRKEDATKVLTHLRTVRSDRTGKPLSPGSRASYYAAFKRAVELGGGDTRGWPKGDKAPRKCREPLSEEDVDRLAKGLEGRLYVMWGESEPKRAGNGDDYHGLWETYDLLELLRGTGLRVDVEALNWDALQWDPQAKLLKVTGKGGHERVIPVERLQTVELLNSKPRMDAMRKLSYSGHLKRWQAAVDRLRIDSMKPTPHAVRHYYATKVYNASGKDLRLVQELLGHADISTTARYLGVNPEDGREFVK